jgi:hypothetical protein
MAIGVGTFTTPTGNIAPELDNDSHTFKARFSSTGVFTHGANETCAHGEYRQYIMGKFEVDGSVLTHMLCNPTQLSQTVYHEDLCGPPTCTAGGYRACPEHATDRYYTPDRATGCDFYMEDAPGFGLVEAGKTYVIELSFKAELIDTSSGVVLQTKTWTVNGTANATVKTKTAMAGLQAHDRIFALHTARNAVTGAAEIHVIVVRRPGEPLLDPNCIGVELKDAQDQPIELISPPVVHEVGNLRRATANIVYTLAQGSHALPLRAEVSARGTTSTMEVDQH